MRQIFALGLLLGSSILWSSSPVWADTTPPQSRARTAPTTPPPSGPSDPGPGRSTFTKQVYLMAIVQGFVVMKVEGEGWKLYNGGAALPYRRNALQLTVPVTEVIAGLNLSDFEQVQFFVGYGSAEDGSGNEVYFQDMISTKNYTSVLEYKKQ